MVVVQSKDYVTHVMHTFLSFSSFYEKKQRIIILFINLLISKELLRNPFCFPFNHNI